MLTVARIKSLKQPGMHADRDGLYLNITKRGSKSWILRYQINGRRREMGLGSIRRVSLAEAREDASDFLKLKRKGIDPKTHRDNHKQAVDNGEVWTFDRCAEAYIAAHKPSWKNPKHADQWGNTLDQYAAPVFGDKPVDEVDTALIMQVLEPIWTTKNETASRLRGRIENILSWAIVHAHREGPNPAVWRGHLSILLPPPQKVQKVQHHTALPYDDIGKFMAELRQQKALSAKALELAILTATRTSEIINAQWDEFDLDNGVWTIPAARMKADREHRVPLSDRALTVLIDLSNKSKWLFPSRNKKPLSTNAMLTLLKNRMDKPFTVHGFRSTFRDWAAEVSSHPRELAEAALAHVLGNKAEAAYQRGDLLDKRRGLMRDWADYIQESQLTANSV